MNWPLFSLLSIIFVLLILSFFFSGAETGLTSVSRSRINKLRLNGNKKAKIIDQLLKGKELTIGTILLGNTIINITCSALFTVIFMNYFGSEGVFLSTIIMTFCILLFCEVLPKTYAIQNPEKVTFFSSYFLSFSVKILSPLTIRIQLIVSSILKLCGLHKDREIILATDAMRDLIALHHSDSTMIKEDLDMLASILDLAEMRISQIMTHRNNLFSLDIAQNREDLIRSILSSSHSRIPLWQTKPENIVGVVHIRDLINALREGGSNIGDIDITRVMSKPWFVLDSTLLSIQIHNFRKNRKHFALVTDEYGTLQGIITLEDILEEIVGDISDEHDLVTESVRKRASCGR